MLELNNITKIYGNGTKALDHVDLKIKKGDLVALMGPSGAGKTTLMNIMGCLDRPTTGSYYLNGEDVGALSESRKARLRNRQFGFVLQDFGLISTMSVEKNIRIPMLYSKDRSGYRERMVSLLKKMHLEGKEKENINDLSGGQRQRVAIIRALINLPEIILADEPTGALDQKTGMEIMDIFLELHKEGKTIIIVTHDMNIAGLCDRKIKVVDGKIQS